MNVSNVVEDVRTPHAIGKLNGILDRAPFLNGSLFAKDVDDPELKLPIDIYWNVDEDAPGLFTIFSRYHWTTDEHRPGESEQTLDPELLSNLFEQLITPTEEGKEPPPRQPQGTYYTPADVADEMVKDALAAAIQVRASGLLTHEQLLSLFGDSDEVIPAIGPSEITVLTDQIESLRIFDAAVGSGECLFSCLIALKTALGKLNGRKVDLTREIIKNQLAGQDINALATQITRLRLFIAIESAEKSAPSREPLPNLEARVVCADTLDTIADPDWRPERPLSLGDSEPGFAISLAELALNRKNWFDAHSEEKKSFVQKNDEILRAKLRGYLNDDGKNELVSDEVLGFIDFPLFGTRSQPARTDPRVLFYEPDRDGFDIVIGNPPYERLGKSVDNERKTKLKEDKGYQSTNINNLYPLFCEVGLALSKSNGGVVTMIVLLSIAFGQSHVTIRRLFEHRCNSIHLRHHDNRPDTTFNETPTVRSPDNRQRTTIVTAILGAEPKPVINSTGLQSWHSEERQQCLNDRSSARIPTLRGISDQRITAQWPRGPTPEVAQLIEAIADQKVAVSTYRSNGGLSLTFPKTAYHFISTIPLGTVTPRSESPFCVSDETAQRLVMATLNGHVAFAWWAAFGDGFHVKPLDLTTMTVPDKWIKNPRSALALGLRLHDVMPHCVVESKQQGGVWRNIDFYTHANDLIDELDRLHIEALGLEVEPLLTHLKIMRSSSSWDFDGAV